MQYREVGGGIDSGKGRMENLRVNSDFLKHGCAANDAVNGLRVLSMCKHTEVK